VNVAAEPGKKTGSTLSLQRGKKFGDRKAEEHSYYPIIRAGRRRRGRICLPLVRRDVCPSSSNFEKERINNDERTLY